MPLRNSLIPEIEVHSERSPISNNKRDRRKFAMGPMHYPSKRVPGCVPELEIKVWKRFIDSGGEYFEGDKSY
jgi:hypothetical protein